MFQRYFSLFVWIFGLQAISYTLSIVAPVGGEGWYNELIRSSLTPPDFVFGLVWPILYLLIAIAGWKLWSKQDLQPAKGYYSLQLLLNWSWMPLFAICHSLWGGALIIFLAIIATLMVIKCCCKARRHCISILLTPYVLWMSFALYLNVFIALSN